MWAVEEISGCKTGGSTFLDTNSDTLRFVVYPLEENDEQTIHDLDVIYSGSWRNKWRPRLVDMQKLIYWKLLCKYKSSILCYFLRDF